MATFYEQGELGWQESAGIEKKTGKKGRGLPDVAAKADVINGVGARPVDPPPDTTYHGAIQRNWRRDRERKPPRPRCIRGEAGGIHIGPIGLVQLVMSKKETAMMRLNLQRSLSAVLLLALLVTIGLALPADAQQGPRFHTRSIVACDPTDASCGIAVVSFPTGVPAIVPVGEAGVSVANQSFPSLATAEAIVDGIINGGLDAPTALANALAVDPSPGDRQLGVAALFPTPSGVSVANHTGVDNFPETCDVLGDTYAVQANLQTSSAVCATMAAAFEATDGSLARRLLASLLAGTPVGTDARGEFSASLKVYSAAWPLASLTELGTDANVNRAANWDEELAFEVNAFLGTLTPPDLRDRVELTRGLAKKIQRALKNLDFYQGPVNGRWTDEAEQALLDFESFNIFFFNPTVVDGSVRFIDGPLADYILTGEPRNVFIPGPA